MLFFTKDQPTTEVWYYEHPYPPGAKSYNKGKPIRIEEFVGERAWWGDPADGFAARVPNEQAWRVPIEQIKSSNYNLDLKNPRNSDTEPGDVDHLLPEYEKLLAQIAETRAALKRELHCALADNAGSEQGDFEASHNRTSGQLRNANPPFPALLSFALIVEALRVTVNPP